MRITPAIAAGVTNRLWSFDDLMAGGRDQKSARRKSGFFLRGGKMRASPTHQESTMFKFTIRDLFWLILVVAMALGWWVDRGSLASELAIAREEITQSPWKWHCWKTAAIGFATAMRDEGWYATVDEDGSGYGFTTPDAFAHDPDRARELNAAKPLPSL
jgi:hypothetical protein